MSANDAEGYQPVRAVQRTDRMALPEFVGLAIMSGGAVLATALGTSDVAQTLQPGLGVSIAAIFGGAVLWLAGRADRAAGSTGKSGWQAFKVELERSRRHERPLVLVRLPAAGTQDSGLDERHASITGHLRSSDLLWVDGTDLFALFTDTDALGAAAAVARLRHLGPDLVGESFAAAFPADGVTTGALVSTVHGRPPRGPMSPLPTLRSMRAEPGNQEPAGFDRA